MQAQRLWQAALGQLQVEMPRAAFDTWVRGAELLAYEDGEFVVGVQNAFARDWLDDRLRTSVKRVLGGLANRTVDVRFVVTPPAEEELESAVLEPPVHRPSNPRFTFENFVVGSSNQLAHAAAQAVAAEPAGPYNPLFIYGGVGLGKTHLLHAIEDASVRAGRRALYVSSEEFTNDLIESIRSQSTADFRERYRRPEVLLLDDVQFIAGKESTQEEFFHTFNALHTEGRQIVLSSDRSPKAFNTLEERLRSRFEWGLTVDIQPPDLETRVAILRSQAEREGREIPLEYLELIARRAKSNIRELEGTLTRAVALAELTGVPLNRQAIETAVSELRSPQPAMTVDKIIAAVARQYEVDEDDLLGPRRTRAVALPRQVAMYLLREETSSSLPQIGRALGGRDHTTVLYGYEKVSDLLESDDALRRQVTAIRSALYEVA